MKKIILTLVAPLLAIGALPLAQASTSITKMAVSANGANERSAYGAKTGSASGTFTVDTTKNTMCFTNMKTKGLVNVTGAHVHLGTLGFDGSIFVAFDISNFNRVGQVCVKSSHSVLVDIAKHPGDYYFNIHSKDFPEGAVRGQLKKSS